MNCDCRLSARKIWKFSPSGNLRLVRLLSAFKININKLLYVLYFSMSNTNVGYVFSNFRLHWVRTRLFSDFITGTRHNKFENPWCRATEPWRNPAVSGEELWVRTLREVFRFKERFLFMTSLEGHRWWWKRVQFLHSTLYNILSWHNVLK